jgi:hypothetical protein
MRLQDTGKALVLSVFFHSFVLFILLVVFDSSNNNEQKKRIDNSTQKSSITVTYATLESSPAKFNETSKPLHNLAWEQQKSPPLVKPTQIPTLPETISTANNSSDLKLQQLKAIKYYSSEEVLEPAKPIDDWILDMEVMPSGRAYQIFIEIWILENGEFEKFELIDASKSDDIARLATLNLLQTSMSPALQNGKPVASTRRLAILIDKDE